MLTPSICAEICGVSATEIEPIWTDRIDQDQAAGVLATFGHAIDWGSERVRNRIIAVVKMDMDLGLQDHARRNLDALRLFIQEHPELSGARAA